MNSRTRLVIFGYGNPSRGDDALGPALMERAGALLQAHPAIGEVELVADFQLQVEHSLDLVGKDLALFVDASVACPAPFAFEVIHPRQDPTYSTHALSPEAVLHVYQSVRKSDPPLSFLLSVRGDRFELGEPLTPEASRHLEAAWDLLARLLQDLDPDAWRGRTTAATRP